jgi:hypothetical protein|nr:MAG TPA: hypothetical protein [Caudoviricetes sp.]
MENKEIVLNELKELYTEGYIFGDIAHFVDTYRYEKRNTEIAKVFRCLSDKEEIEILEEYIRYRKNERANL